jgi:hypothetical protein
MASKRLFQSALTDLFTSAEVASGQVGERTGEIYELADGKKYRFVKNISATALLYHGACLKALTSVLASINKNVRSTNTATAKTSQLSIPAGVPVTAIGASGSSTGDHGFVQIAGPARVSMVVSNTPDAASGWPGWTSIATNLPATDAGWDVAEAPTADSASVAYIRLRGVRLVAAFAEGTAAAARSAAVEVMCE